MEHYVRPRFLPVERKGELLLVLAPLHADVEELKLVGAIRFLEREVQVTVKTVEGGEDILCFGLRLGDEEDIVYISGITTDGKSEDDLLFQPVNKEAGETSRKAAPHRQTGDLLVGFGIKREEIFFESHLEEKANIGNREERDVPLPHGEEVTGVLDSFRDRDARKH